GCQGSRWSAGRCHGMGQIATAWLRHLPSSRGVDGLDWAMGLARLTDVAITARRPVVVDLQCLSRREVHGLALSWWLNEGPDQCVGLVRTSRPTWRRWCR